MFHWPTLVEAGRGWHGSCRLQAVWSCLYEGPAGENIRVRYYWAGAGRPCLVKCVGQQSDEIIFLKTFWGKTRADEWTRSPGVDTLLQPDDEILWWGDDEEDLDTWWSGCISDIATPGQTCSNCPAGSQSLSTHRRCSHLALVSRRKYPKDRRNLRQNGVRPGSLWNNNQLLHCVLHFSLVVLMVVVVGVLSPVVSEVVVLLLVLGQAVHQVVRGLEGDVWEEPVHDVTVPVQLKLDGVPGWSVE